MTEAEVVVREGGEAEPGNIREAGGGEHFKEV